jgi:DinB superfamily
VVIATIAPMDDATRAALLDRYRAGYDEVVAALAGIDDAGLDARPGPDEWTAREVVHHLADSEMTSALRLRKLLAEDEPRIEPYDEAGYAKRLPYDRPVEGSLEALRGARASTAAILERLPESAWTRSGHHPEHDRYTVEDWLEIYAAHAFDHADQIRRARDHA